jgi:hypothetical protein
LKGNALKTQLDANNTYLDDLKTAIRSALQSLDSLLPGVSAAFDIAMSGKSPGDYADIKSEESFLD